MKEKTTDNNVYGTQTLWKRLQKDLELVNGLSLDQVLRRSGILPKTARKASGDRIAEDMLLEFAKSGHPIFRATTPLSRGKLKSKGKRESIHTLQCWTRYDWYNLSHYSLCQSAQCLRGAVAAICDEFVGQPDNTGEPVVLEGQSIVLGEVKAWSTCSRRTWRFQCCFAKIFPAIPTTFTWRQIE